MTRTSKVPFLELSHNIWTKLCAELGADYDVIYEEQLII